jgi:hypothetical protein
MSPQKRRPQPRKGRTRTAAAAQRNKRGSDRLMVYVGIGVLIVGVILVFALRPSSNSSKGGLQLGDHWHTALGVYACDHWDGDANWATPFDGSTPVKVDTTTYNALHSHGDGLIHMEPSVAADTGTNANLGNYFTSNGFELSSTHVKFVTADLTNGDKCGNAKGTLHWLVDGKERTGDPAKYVLHDHQWIVVAFLADSKKITSLGKPPSFKNLANAEGSEGVPTSMPAPSSSSTPSSTPNTSTPTTSTPTTSTPTT